MLRLLIADDEELVRRGLTALVQREALGLTIVGTAVDGLEALEMAERTRPDIVLTDIRMPGLSGLDLIARLRGGAGTPRCIILSGYHEFDYARRAISLGVSDYLLKPVDPDDLLALLGRLHQEIMAARDAAGDQSRGHLLQGLMAEGWPAAPLGHRDALLAAIVQGREGDAVREAQAFLTYLDTHHSPSAAAALRDELTVLVIRQVQSHGGRVDGLLRAEAGLQGQPASPAGGTEGEAALVSLVRRAVRLAHGDRQSRAPRGTIAELRAYIESSPGDDLTITALAQRMHLNPKYLGELFKEATGESLGDFVIRMRMRHACELLAGSSLKVYAVAQSVGYSSPQHFATMFRSIIGISPAEYRDQRRQSWRPVVEEAPECTN